jgi:putative ABC transport system permease protein
MNTPQQLSWRTALKIAWREGRASSVKFAFVILAVAVGVGALTGVRGFSRAFHLMLVREARTLIASDLSVRTFALASPEQEAAMRQLAARGVEHTWITETVSMAATGNKPPLLVSVKAVDPAKYPYYGKVILDPPAPSLAAALRPDTVAVSDDLLLRLGVKVGDSIRLGGLPFRIVATVEQEPDRMSGSLNVGPRLMLSRQALDRAGLMAPGSRAAERFLFRIPPEIPVEQVRSDLKIAFPEAMIADFRQAHPAIERGLDEATMFLSLVSLISLIVGALGVATAIRAHLDQRLDSIAVMKCLGARSNQIMRIYVIQTAVLGLMGSTMGIAVGLVVQLVFPTLIARYFHLRPSLRLDWVPSVQGVAIGLLTSLLFTLPPLLGIRRVRPNLIFRREMAESKLPWRERLRNGRPTAVAGGILIVALCAIAASLTGEPPAEALRIGAYFVGGVAASLALLSATAWVLLRLLRRTSRLLTALPAPVRHGVANLYRPGNHAEAILVALGVGVMFTLSVYVVQHGVLREMMRTTPPGMPNVFFLDVRQTQADSVMNLVRAQRGIERPPELIATVAVKLIRINGNANWNAGLKGFARRFQRTRAVAALSAKPPYADVAGGQWWDPAKGEPGICASEETVRILKVKPGDRMEFTAGGKTIAAPLACVVRIDSIHLMGRMEFLFDERLLQGLPAVYYGSVRLKPSDVAALQLAMYEKFPTVTVVNVADVLRIIQEVVDQISIEVRFISAFAILAGVIILASSVAGTRFRRIREVVILKTLGATRARIAGIFSVEFLILGAVAGLMGSLLAAAFGALVVKRLLKGDPHFQPAVYLIAIAATALVANVTGWLASYRILGQKPLEVLREE